MNQLRSVNKTLMKEFNRMLVIDQIRSCEEISRSEISKNTGLGLSTLTKIVDELIGENLVCEVGEGVSNGGRKPVLLKFNGDFGYVVGIKIERDRMIFCRSNLEARIMEKKVLSYSRTSSNAEINSLLIDGIRKVISGTRPDQRFCGIGIATSGLIDRDAKVVIHSPILSWENYSFEQVEESFSVPVLVDNDANVFSLGQIWRGLGSQYRNFIGISVGAGVGAGIVINNQLYRGEFGGAGEIGHTVIQQEGTPCYCGQRGCLEMYASDAFTISEAKRLVAMRAPTKLSELPELSLDGIYQAAEQGDDYAQEILIKQGDNLGIGLRNTVNFMNPGAIIVGGESIRGKEFLLQGLTRQLQTHFFAKHKQELKLHVCDMGEDIFLIGACALVVYDLFKAPIYK